MAFWWKKMPKEPTLKSWELPGDIGTVSLPSSLSVEMESDTTLLAYPASQAVTLRLSSISFTMKGDDSSGIAKTHICKRASECQSLYYEIGDKGVYSVEEPSELDGEPTLIKYWYVGSKCTITVISATIPSTKLGSQEVKDLVDIMPRIIESVTINKSHTIATFDGQEVPITKQAVDQFAQKISAFGPSENGWLDANRHLAAALSVKYGDGGDLGPETLDAVFARWMQDNEDKEPAESVANALGSAFGDYLVEQHDFRWVVVTDQYGTDFAVKHRVADVIAFPSSSIIKRIDRNETECFQSLRVGILGVLRKHFEQSN